MNSLFQRAAELLLEGDKAGSVPDAEAARRLLADLDYMAPASPASPAQLANRMALLRAAGRMSRLFRLAIPSAPGLVFLGGEADPAAIGEGFAGAPAGSLAGSGLTLREAFGTRSSGLRPGWRPAAPTRWLDVPPLAIWWPQSLLRSELAPTVRVCA